MYQVIAVTGGNNQRQGGMFKGEFAHFEDAKQYRKDINELGNIYIKMPDGSWWPEDYK